MKYERLHGSVMSCRECGARGRWLWWWNRRNGMKSIFRRFCPKCGRARNYRFIGFEINKINLGCKGMRVTVVKLRRGRT